MGKLLLHAGKRYLAPLRGLSCRSLNKIDLGFCDFFIFIFIFSGHVARFPREIQMPRRVLKGTGASVVSLMVWLLVTSPWREDFLRLRRRRRRRRRREVQALRRRVAAFRSHQNPRTEGKATSS